MFGSKIITLPQHLWSDFTQGDNHLFLWISESIRKSPLEEVVTVVYNQVLYLFGKLSWPPTHFQTQIMFLTPYINLRSNKANQDDQEVIQDDQEVIQIDQEVRLRDRGCNSSG